KSGGEWAGVLLDGGEADISNCIISGAESAIYAHDAALLLDNSTLSGNHYAVTLVGGKTRASVTRTSITGNDYGMVTIDSSEPVMIETQIKANRKKDLWRETLLKAELPTPSPREITTPVARSYKNEALVGDTLWSGRIRVEGNLRIPEGSRLIIAPGTVVEFTRMDSNNDQVGENGLLVQGIIIAKGTRQAPITFRSGEKNRQPGDWDSINIMNSDRAENLVENCVVEDAYRGLHFHYSTVLVSGSTFRNNYRAIQFQESTVEIRDSWFIANRSGVQGRDSYISFSGNRLLGNHQGVNFFRCNLIFTGNRASGSRREAVRIREGNATVSENMILGNRFGMMIADAYYGRISGNVIADSGENGLAMRNVDNLEVSGNYLGRNGANGLNLQEARAAVRGNLIAANGERGIGVVSFSGTISDNNISNNGLYAIDHEGSDDIEANGNWWGGDDPARVVFDKRRDPARGKVLAGTPAGKPLPFTWPVQSLDGELSLAGEVLLNGHPLVNPGSFLTIVPGTTLRFAAGSGLIVRGRLKAEGTPDRPIRFTSQGEQKPEAWDEIILEQATDSTITHAIIEYATWGVHGHFTNLLLDHVVARNNSGGMRFRSGPVTIRQSVFRNNGIGIRAYMGNALIEENVITGNEVGLFVRERGGGLVIRKNNFSNNSDYNIRSGDFNTEDIKATDNWWGSQEPLSTVYDGRQEEGIGKVLLEPFLSSPVPLEKAGAQ
ncbi:MAG TPA: right-handed parallel beta-helix repeat-containing protein, partial [Geobacteraceae bacterium]|nr:right-handed parallel beta-helix repeat-containing protein [Geobacteraceae bacterium]